jgi:hypothetical protein
MFGGSGYGILALAESRLGQALQADDQYEYAMRVQTSDGLTAGSLAHSPQELDKQLRKLSKEGYEEGKDFCVTTQDDGVISSRVPSWLDIIEDDIGYEYALK